MSKNKDDTINENYKSKNIILDYESSEDNYDNDNYENDNYEENYEEYCNETIDIIYKELSSYINSKDLFIGEYLTTKSIDNFIKNNKITL